MVDTWKLLSLETVRRDREKVDKYIFTCKTLFFLLINNLTLLTNFRPFLSTINKDSNGVLSTVLNTLILIVIHCFLDYLDKLF